MSKIGVVLSRIISHYNHNSFFLFGPRGTGKTTWIKAQFPHAIYIDLLEDSLFTELLARPGRLDQMIPNGFAEWVIIDEVQKIPALLDEVHRLIEKRHIKFILTGSSARKLKTRGANLLAGRAYTCHMHPLTCAEWGRGFDVESALKSGCLPRAMTTPDATPFLASYVSTYLKEEIAQEGLTRNLGAFARFLETASFSQGGVLNMSQVARECAVERKTVEDYFTILEDLLLAVRIPVFVKKAKRKMLVHPKFYFFDAGVYRSIRPKGPLDAPEAIDGHALETLVLQHLRAYNDYHRLGYTLHYWRTHSGDEVDFVLYGERGILAFEVKRSRRFDERELSGLRLFLKDYPSAKAWFFYGGERAYDYGDIRVIPITEGLAQLETTMKTGTVTSAE